MCILSLWRMRLVAEGRVGREADGVDDERVAFPVADRVAVEREIGILGMRAAVGEDLPPLRCTPRSGS